MTKKRRPHPTVLEIAEACARTYGGVLGTSRNPFDKEWEWPILTWEGEGLGIWLAKQLTKLSNRQISLIFNVSPRTFDRHVEGVGTLMEFDHVYRNQAFKAVREIDRIMAPRRALAAAAARRPATRDSQKPCPARGEVAEAGLSLSKM